MPRKDGRLTPQEQRLAVLQAGGVELSEAARRAGYAHSQSAGQALARPAVAAEVSRLQQERLFNDVLPLAVDVHIAVLTSPHTPAGAKVQAVKLAYDRTLGAQDGPDRKPVEQMTAGELAAEIARLKQREARLEDIKAGRATVVDVEPLEEPAPGDVLS